MHLWKLCKSPWWGCHWLSPGPQSQVWGILVWESCILLTLAIFFAFQHRHLKTLTSSVVSWEQITCCCCFAWQCCLELPLCYMHAHTHRGLLYFSIVHQLTGVGAAVAWRSVWFPLTAHWCIALQSVPGAESTSRSPSWVSKPPMSASAHTDKWFVLLMWKRKKKSLKKSW